MKIILDTNILMAVAQWKADVFSQLRGKKIYTISPVVEELKGISKGKGKGGTAAKVALKLIKSKSLKTLESNREADTALISYAKKGYIIVTQDKLLQAQIKKLGLRVMYLRQKKYLDIK